MKLSKTSKVATNFVSRQEQAHRRRLNNKTTTKTVRIFRQIPATIRLVTELYSQFTCIFRKILRIIWSSKRWMTFNFMLHLYLCVFTLSTLLAGFLAFSCPFVELVTYLSGKFKIKTKTLHTYGCLIINFFENSNDFESIQNSDRLLKTSKVVCCFFKIENFVELSVLSFFYWRQISRIQFNSSRIFLSTCHGREQETFQTRQSGSKNQKGSCGGKYRRTDTQR